MKSKLLTHTQDINAYFKKRSGQIYTIEVLADLLAEFQLKGWAGSRATIDQLLEILLPVQKLKTATFVHSSGVKTARYYTGKPSDLKMLAAIFPQAYFSHATALFCLGRIPELNPDIYKTTEQLDKGTKPDASLQQQNVDDALAKSAKLSRDIWYWKDFKLVRMHRKVRVPQMGILKNGEGYRYTDLERTMLDIIVRPETLAGSQNVLTLMAGLKTELDCQKLQFYLKRMEFIYPYQQCIGFYLERAGFTSGQYLLFERKNMPLRFYLQHGMHSKLLDQRWNLYYPADLNLTRPNT